MRTKIEMLKKELNWEEGKGFIAFIAEDYIIEDFEDMYDVSGLKQLDMEDAKVEDAIDTIEDANTDYYGNTTTFDAIYFKL